MKDLKVYYQTEYPKLNTISEGFDKEIEKIAEKYGLTFSGSGVEIGTGIRDLHYIKKEERELYLRDG
ncbi:hypothetical protein ES702_07710 [subsurface metagenome]